MVIASRIALARLLRAAFLAATVLVAFALSGPSGIAVFQPAAAAEVGYAIGKPVCKSPRNAGHARCMAIRRVMVEKTVAGARAFYMGAGAEGPRSTGPAGGLTPSDLATAYALPTTGGAGQIVALVDAYNDPNIEADLQIFDKQYGLSTCTKANGCLTVVGQTGSTTALPANDTTGWSIEETLDVQTVHAICQGCKIILVEANSSYNSDLDVAENTAIAMHATEVSNSFGGPESGTNATDLAAYNHPGVVITASTGDDGFYSYDDLSSTNEANFPASSPTVVSVGGTSLYLGQTAVRQSETVWNDNGANDYFQQLIGQSLGGGGGGCSTKFQAPGWQTHVTGWGGTGCGAMRLSADVSAVADYLTGLDIYDSYACSECLPTPGWATLGGTSLASPLIASVFALAGGAKNVPYPAVTLYGHPGATYDVTVGGNGWCSGAGAASCGDPNLLGYGIVDCDYPASGTVPSVGNRACDARPGYDGPTGVGTPNGITAFTKIRPTSPIAGPASIAAGVSGKWTTTFTDPFPGGVVAQFSWAWGDGQTSVTTIAAAKHAYSVGGNYSVSMTAKDSYGVTSIVNTIPVSIVTKQASR